MPEDNRHIKPFQGLLASLEEDRARAEGSPSWIEGYGKAILATRERISRVQALSPKVLRSREGEVAYFRAVWPRVYGQLFYYQRAHAFYMERSALPPDRLEGMIRREELEAARYFRVNRDFWLYYTSGSTVIDGQFTREYSRGCVYDPLCLVIDPAASTLASYKAAWGMAYQSYKMLLEGERHRLLHPSEIDSGEVTYTWKGTDADAVEWLYSLNANRVILHNGEPADIIQLSRWFKVNFRKEIVNIYDRFKAVRIRKKDRVPFMRRLLAGLEKKMDEADGKFDG
jgi:RteC protein